MKIFFDTNVYVAEATLAVGLAGTDAWIKTQINTLSQSGDFAAGANLGIDTGGGTCAYDDSGLAPCLPVLGLG